MIEAFECFLDSISLGVVKDNLFDPLIIFQCKGSEQ